MEQEAINHRGFDRVLGNVDKHPELAAIVGAIFSRAASFTLPNGARLRLRIMGSKYDVFGVDYQGIRYIEQNRRTHSDEAQRARDGASIVWVIHTHDANTGQPLPEKRWIGKVEDGIVRMR